MKRISLTLIILAFAAAAFAQGNYYDAVINLTGQQLYTALHSLISTNTYSSYTGAKEFLFQELDNTNGYVTCIYTGQSYYVGYNYTGSNNPNTEHTYAQSWFSSSESSRKKADLHHLFPSNSVVNSSRSNYPIFTVANHASANVYYNDTPWQSYRGQSATGYTVFEPADESKGDIARALLYFNTRYYDTLTQQNVNMIPDLVAWNTMDPPDATEIARNSAIHGFLGNRNPFVDHPEFVNRIWGPVASEDPAAPAMPLLVLDRVYPNPFRESVKISLSCKDPATVTATVYNMRGQKVRAWQESLPRGSSELQWDGRDGAGEALTPGVYLIRLSSQECSLTARVLLY
ncbi:MAG: endonuclease [Candidatus Cloacimonadota bacterium]|nr:endonuclease [Candidatus Cloacimonadota bacterium]